MKGTDKENAKLITKEVLKEGNTSLTVFRHYATAMGIVGCVGLFLINLVCPLVYQVMIYWLALWGDDSKDGEAVDPVLRTTRVTVYGVLNLCVSATLHLTAVVSLFTTLKASKVLHTDMLRCVLRCPISFFDTTPAGRILNRFSQDIDDLDQQIPNLIRSCMLTIVNVVVMTVAASIGVPLFIIAFAVVFTANTLLQVRMQLDSKQKISQLLDLTKFWGLTQRFFMASNRQLKRIYGTKNSFLFSHVSGSVAGSSVIRASNAGNKYETRFLQLLDESTAANYMMSMCQRWMTVRFNLLANFLIFSSSLFPVLSKGTIAPGVVGFVLVASTSLIGMLKFSVVQITGLETQIVCAERVHEYCHLESEAEWHKPNIPLSPQWPECGEISFRNYSTRYREGMDLVLKDLNFTIEAGEKVRVVVIDGVKIANIGLFDLRSRLAIIPQDPVLFSGTLRINLDPFRKYGDPSLWSALEHSHLKPFVKGLENGLDFAVNEGGQNLSVGQRQLVCLARALLRNATILILDEATASVDMDTDALIQATIRKEFATSKIITIAHRINTIMDYDRVLVLDQGCVAEFDSPKNLLKNEQSLFYELVKDAKLL